MTGESISTKLARLASRPPYRPTLSTSGYAKTVGGQLCVSGPSMHLLWRSCLGWSSPLHGPCSTHMASDGVAYPSHIPHADVAGPSRGHPLAAGRPGPE